MLIYQVYNKNGNKIKKLIVALKSSLIKNVRGKGLMIGIEFSEPIAKLVAKELLNQGITVGNSGDSVLRLLPPFILLENDIHYFVKIFTSALSKFSFSSGSSDIVNIN